MIRLVIWSLTGDGWCRVAAVPVHPDRAAAALANAQSWFAGTRHEGLVRAVLEPPLPESSPVLAAVTS